jgi:histidinol-phosphate/aromatic aminotransferase/cobyric acid decarboxylase-like protein
MDIEKHLAKGVTRTVYSLIYPETTAVLDKLLKSAPHHLYERAYEDTQERFHLNFAQLWLNWVSPVVSLAPELTHHFYPTAGSSEAIRDSIASYATLSLSKGVIPIIHVFEGEYEGYEQYAHAYQVKVIKHNRSNYLETLTKETHGLFYISQPSAVDGNLWNGFQTFIEFLKTKQPKLKVMVDLCYVGTVAKDYEINLESNNIDCVFFSLSKVFGVYYHRIGGVFSRHEIKSLVGNKWFKNILSLKLGEDLLKSSTVFSLAKKYKKVQEEEVRILRQFYPNLECSDVILLCSKQLRDDQSEKYFLRGKDTLRLCITPAMSRKIL